VNKVTANDISLATSSETDVGYGQLFGILLRRRFWFLSVFAGSLLIAALFALVHKTDYESSMQLLVEPNYQGQGKQLEIGLDRTQQSTDTSIDRDYATQINLMRSSGLIGKAIQSLKSTYPDLELAKLQKTLTLTQVVEKAAGNEIKTKIFEVKYTDTDPVKAQKFLLALQKVYRDYNLKQQKLRLDEGLALLNKQLPEARRDVAAAEGDLETFRKQHNLVDPLEHAKAISAALDQAQREREGLQAEFEQKLAQYNTIQQQVGYSFDEAVIAAQLSQSTRYQNVLDKLQQTDLVLATQRSLYKDADPTVQTLLDQRQNELTVLQEAVGQVLGASSVGGASAERLLSTGQLSPTDVALVNQLVATRTDLAGLEARDQSLVNTEQQLSDELNQLPNLIGEFNRLQPEVEISRETLQKLLEVRQELSVELARGGFNWQLVEAPQLGEPVGLGFAKILLLGGVVGLFLGGIAAFIREALDNSIHTSDQLKQSTALPLLGVIPDLASSKMSRFMIFSGQSSVSDADSVSEILDSPVFQESLNLIYKNIYLQNPKLKSLAITSAVPNEGKSTLALGLALSAARSHQKVLLIDADLRCPTLHQHLNLPNETGLSTLLSELQAGKLRRAPQQKVSLSGASIDVITAGSIPTDPVKLLSSQTLKQLIASAQNRYDLVLLDTSPVLGLVDAVQVGSFSEGVVMIERISLVTQAELTQAVTTLKPLNVLGIVANGAGEPKRLYRLPGEQNGNTPFQALNVR
jgi:polysaccharide biosynthesis transport protein